MSVLSIPRRLALALPVLLSRLEKFLVFCGRATITARSLERLIGLILETTCLPEKGDLTPLSWSFGLSLGISYYYCEMLDKKAT